MAVKDTFVSGSIDTGVAFIADADHEDLPDDATSELEESIAAGNLGVLSDSGLSIGETRTSTDFKDFDQSNYITVQTEYNGQFQFTLYDVDLESVKKMLHGDENVTYTEATTAAGTTYQIDHKATPLPLKSFVFWTRSGDKRERQVVKYARVTEIGERVKHAGTPDMVQVTIKATKDEDGLFFTTYGDDGVKLTENP